MPTYIGVPTSGSSTGSANNLRAFGRNFEIALSGFGWSRDLGITGQTVFNPDYIPTAVDLPTSGVGSLFQVWKATDSLTGSFPIVLKWGLSKNVNNNICLDMQVGTGTDSSTNIIPPTYKLRFQTSSIPDNTSSNSYFCGDSGRFSFGLNFDASANVGRFFSLERSYNVNGEETNEYFTVISCHYPNADSPHQFCLNSTGGFTSLVGGHLMHLAPTESSFPSTFNGNTFISPVFPVLGSIGNPCKNVGITKQTTIGNGDIFQGVIYNNTYTYIGFNGNNGFRAADGSSSLRPTTIFMRWE